jgi:hypothetical protein
VSLRHVLNPEDEAWAREIGRQRLEQAPGDPRFAYTTGRDGLDTHSIGAMAELAFARALGLEWPARVNTFRSLPDVDPNWEVRWSSRTHKVKIAVDDDPDILVAHVIGRSPGFEMIGCIIAGYVQRNYPATDPGERGWKAHFVDDYRLTPFDENFHKICAWTRGAEGWACAYCGKPFEEKPDVLTPEQGEGSPVGAGMEGS